MGSGKDQIMVIRKPRPEYPTSSGGKLLTITATVSKNSSEINTAFHSTSQKNVVARIDD